MTIEFPELQQLFGAYFNQDWMIEYATADDVIEAFLIESCSEDLAVVRLEIRELLSLGKEEDVLRRFLLEDMSCCYCYWNEWPSGDTWLRHIETLLVG